MTGEAEAELVTDLCASQTFRLYENRAASYEGCSDHEPCLEHSQRQRARDLGNLPCVQEPSLPVALHDALLLESAPGLLLVLQGPKRYCVTSARVYCEEEQPLRPHIAQPQFEQCAARSQIGDSVKT